MTTKERIRAEIERLYDGEAPKHDQQCEFEDGYFTGIDTISNFLDTLEEPVSEDLEEAAENYEQTRNDLNAISDNEIVRRAFIAGAKWQKQKMLEGAVEGYVNFYEDSCGILMAEVQVGCPYHLGDKVKVIIVKED